MTQSQTDIAALVAELRRCAMFSTSAVDLSVMCARAATALEVISQPRSIDVTEEMVERAANSLIENGYISAMMSEDIPGEAMRAGRLVLVAALHPEGK